MESYLDNIKKLTSILKTTNQDEILNVWNECVDEVNAQDRESHLSPIYKCDVENISNVLNMFEVQFFAESLLNGSFNTAHKYFYYPNYGCHPVSINNVYAGINFNILFSYLNEIGYKKRKRNWENASKNAVTLWDNGNECVKVEITSSYVKFFRCDDFICSCYTYRPLHQLKHDDIFVSEIIKTLMESCQYNESEFNAWILGNCELPPFPISVIFHSDYQGYRFEEYE